MQRQLIAEEWCKFAAQTIPQDAAPEQRKAMRAAFYCGVDVLLKLVLDGFTSGNDNTEPTEEDVNLMTGIMLEMEGFAKQVANGSW